MERHFKIGDHVCVVNGPRQGKVGTIMGYGSSKDTYTVRLSGIGDFIFVEYDLIPQEKMDELNDEKEVLVGDLKHGYSYITAKEAEELRMLDRALNKVDEIVESARFINGVGYAPLHIEKVIFNNPATIVFWSDGKKTVVKCAGDEAFDEEKGLAMAISKRVLGNQGNYYNEFKKWLPEIEVYEDRVLRYECNSCKYLETPPGDEPCKDCYYYNSKYKPKKGDK